MTPEFLHGFATLFLFSGVLPAALLFRPYAGLGVLAFTLSVLLPESRGGFFEVNPYAWQLPLLLWAWWCIRAGLKAPPGPRPLVGLARPLGPGLFPRHLDVGPQWAAPLGRQPPRGAPRAAGAALRLPRGRWALAVVPALLGMAGEACVRWAFHRFVRATYQRGFHSELRVDWGHLLENTRQVWLGLETPAVLARAGRPHGLHALSVFQAKRSAAGAGVPPLGRWWAPSSWACCLCPCWQPSATSG